MSEEEEQLIATLRAMAPEWSIGVSDERPDGKFQWITWRGPASKSNPSYTQALREGQTHLVESRIDGFRTAVDEAIWRHLTT